MAKKRKAEKSPKSQGWDFLSIIRRNMKPSRIKYYLGGIIGVVGLITSVIWKDNKYKNIQQKSKFYKVVLLSITAICVIFAAFVIYCLAYGNKSYPNITVAGVKVGGKNKTEVKKTLDRVFNNIETQPIKLTYKEKTWELNPKDIKLVYDQNETQKQIMTVGREKGFSRRLWRRLEAIFKVNNLSPSYSFDKVNLNNFIDKVADDVDIPEKDATGLIKGNNVTFVKERSGFRVQKGKLLAKITQDFNQMKSDSITVPAAEFAPKVTLGDTEEARQRVITMENSRLTLSWQKGTFNVGPDIFNDWIKFKSEAIKNDPNNYHLVAYVDTDEVKSYLKKISKNIDASPKNAKLAMNNGVLTATEPSAIGYAFDQQEALPKIQEAVTQGQVKTISLNVKEVQPDVSSDNLANLGITEIIGSGSTNFKGSTPERKINVANGMRIVNGTIIKPGEEFSAVKAIGNVDASTGFVQGLVIKNNQTVPEYGGGLCQISSTLFRGALNTGLRVTERKNHAYRVHYYETDGDGKTIGPGLDSTIYGPHPDLRFVNDTGHYILIQGHIEKTKLTFDFWGTKDGRVSTIDGPHISKETPAPPAQYVNTDTLYVGQKQQIEWSAVGATVVVNYSVTKDGKEIIKQTFTSKFKPWAAKYLVGTKPKPATPAPAPTPAAPVAPPVAPPVDPTAPVTPAQ